MAGRNLAKAASNASNVSINYFGHLLVIAVNYEYLRFLRYYDVKESSGQRRSQKFADGGQVGGLESGTRQRGPAAEPRWGSGGEVPRNWRQLCL